MTLPIPRVVANDVTHLKSLVQAAVEQHGPHCSLNHIDVSQLTSLGQPFVDTDFNGDISEWDVSNVTSFSYLFMDSVFNGDISQWNTQSATNMSQMFTLSNFNGDISRWNTSRVAAMKDMFNHSVFNGDISNWDTARVQDMSNMFEGSHFNGDISRWDVRNVLSMQNMFKKSVFNQDLSPWKPLSIGAFENQYQYEYEDALNSETSFMPLHFAQKHYLGLVLQAREHNSFYYSCASMFEDCPFAHDISNWPLPHHVDHVDMFRNNPAGLAAQSISPWVLGVHAVANTVPADARWAKRLDEVEPLVRSHGSAYAINQLCKQHAPHWYDTIEPMIVQTPLQLHHCIRKAVALHGPKVDLNHLDVSGIRSLDYMFDKVNFMGDISRWDVSAVISMVGTFKNTRFNGDISKWDVSQLRDASGMFERSKFNGDLSGWNVDRLIKANDMFAHCDFTGDLSGWNPKHLVSTSGMFAKSKFNAPLAHWDMSHIGDVSHYLEFYSAFQDSTLEAFAATPFGQSMAKATQKAEPQRKFSAMAMFDHANFAHDVSEWQLDGSLALGMFVGNEEGWRAQQMQPWTVQVMMHDDLPVHSHTWKAFLPSVQGLLDSLCDTVSDKAAYAWTMHQQQFHGVKDDTLEVDGFSF